MDLERLPTELVKKMYPFQLEGVKFGISRFGRILLADEMGVGKTVQALAIALYYRRDWPLLIVAPSFLRFIWQQEILRWLRHPAGIREKDVQIIVSSKDHWRPSA